MSRACAEAAASTRGSAGSAGRPCLARSTLIAHSSAARTAAAAAALGRAVAPVHPRGLAGSAGSADTAGRAVAGSGTVTCAEAAGAAASARAAASVTPPAARVRRPGGRHAWRTPLCPSSETGHGPPRRNRRGAPRPRTRQRSNQKLRPPSHRSPLAHAGEDPHRLGEALRRLRGIRESQVRARRLGREPMAPRRHDHARARGADCELDVVLVGVERDPQMQAAARAQRDPVRPELVGRPPRRARPGARAARRGRGAGAAATRARRRARSPPPGAGRARRGPRRCAPL